MENFSSNASDLDVREICDTLWCSLETTIIISFSVFIILANIADLIVIGLFYGDLGAPEYFRLSLACADFGVGVFVTPFSIHTVGYKEWAYGETWCSVEGILVAIFCSVSIFSLLLISVDRYVAIMHSLRYVSLMTKTKCLCLNGLVWVSCFSIFLTYKLTADDFYFDDKSFLCTIDFPQQGHFTIFILLCVVLPPVLILSYTNWKIFLAARKHLIQISDMHMRVFSVSSTIDSHSSVNKSIRRITTSPTIKFKLRDIKTIKMYFIVVGSFLIAWLPYSFLQLVLCTTDLDIPQPIVFIIQWTAMGNSFWNPFVYFVMHKKYRQGCSRALKTVFRQSYKVNVSK